MKSPDESQKLPEMTIAANYDSLQKYSDLVLKLSDINNSTASIYALKAKKIAFLINSPKSLISYYMILGNLLFELKSDSSFYYFSKALTISDSCKEEAFRDRLLYDLGLLYAQADDFKNSLIYLDSALKLDTRSSDFGMQSRIFNSLGNIYKDNYDTGSARKMYDSSYLIAERHSLSRLMGTSLGNLSNFEKTLAGSRFKIKKAVELLKTGNDADLEIASTLTNLSTYYPDNPDSGIYYNKLALTNVSPQISPELYICINNNLAYNYLESNNLEEAEKCLLKNAIPVAEKTGYYSWLSTAYDSYADILKKEGRIKEALDYQKLSLESAQKAYQKSASDQVRLLAVILDVRKKENLISETRLQLNETRHQNRLIIVLAVFILLTFSGLFIIVFQKKRIQLQLQRIISAQRIMEAEEKERTRLGREFHDIAGQRFAELLVFYNQLEYKNEEQKKYALQMISEIKGTVRELSHRMNPEWLLRFSLEESIEGLCRDIEKSALVNIKLNISKPLPSLSKDITIQMFRIFQELVANYLKYASGSEIIIHLYSQKNRLYLKYKDEGPGFDPDKDRYHGIGISNIIERVKYLNGKITMDSRPGFGTYYEISIPINSEKNDQNIIH